MVSHVPQNWLSTKIHDDLDELVGVLEIDNALLMSLLHDSLVENGDDERLLSIIKSLEAEINPHCVVMNDTHDRIISPEGYVVEDCQPSDAWEINDLDCSISEDRNLKFSWINDVEMLSSRTGDDVNMWCMEACGDELDNVAEFGEVCDYYYSAPMSDVVVPSEEQGYTISLWQETCESVMYS